MNIGVILHSKTGTTRKFGKLIAENLKLHNHTVDLIELKTDPPVDSGSVRQSKSIHVVNIPDCTKYDALLVGGPVWAFSASPVAIACIKEMQGIADKKFLPFVTMAFPFTCMGGTQAIALMSSNAATKGAAVLPGKIIPKLFHNFSEQMEKMAAEIPSCLE